MVGSLELDPNKFFEPNRFDRFNFERPNYDVNLPRERQAMMGLADRDVLPLAQAMDNRSLLNAYEQAQDPARYTSRQGYSYVVQSGDTLSSIADGNVALAGLIAADNGLRGSNIRAGQNLFVAELNQYADAQQKQFANYGGQLYRQDNARLEADAVRNLYAISNGTQAERNANPYYQMAAATKLAMPYDTSGYGTIGPLPSYPSAIQSIFSSDMALSQKISMAWENTKFYYRGNETVQGAVQAVGGVLEVAGATALSGTGIGTAVGLPMAFHGGDNIGTGLSRMLYQTRLDTFTYQAVAEATGSPNAAYLVDTGLPLVGGVMGLGQALKASEAAKFSLAERVVSGEINNGAFSLQKNIRLEVWRSTFGATGDDYARLVSDLPKWDPMRNKFAQALREMRAQGVAIRQDTNLGATIGVFGGESIESGMWFRYNPEKMRVVDMLEETTHWQQMKAGLPSKGYSPATLEILAKRSILNNHNLSPGLRFELRDDIRRVQSGAYFNLGGE